MNITNYGDGNACGTNPTTCITFGEGAAYNSMIGGSCTMPANAGTTTAGVYAFSSSFATLIEGAIFNVAAGTGIQCQSLNGCRVLNNHIIFGPGGGQAVGLATTNGGVVSGNEITVTGSGDDAINVGFYDAVISNNSIFLDGRSNSQAGVDLNNTIGGITIIGNVILGAGGANQKGIQMRPGQYCSGSAKASSAIPIVEANSIDNVGSGLAVYIDVPACLPHRIIQNNAGVPNFPRHRK
jgi:hypothetical protein